MYILNILNFLQAGDVLPDPQFTVTDPDEDEVHEFAILSGNHSDKFFINTSTGSLSFAISFGQVFVPTEITLEIQVADKNGLIDVTHLIILVNHVNTRPAIANLPNVVYIPESLDAGSWVFTITVTDPDIGDERNFRLSCDPASGLDTFTINNTSKCVNYSVLLYT